MHRGRRPAVHLPLSRRRGRGVPPRPAPHRAGGRCGFRGVRGQARQELPQPRRGARVCRTRLRRRTGRHHAQLPQPAPARRARRRPAGCGRLASSGPACRGRHHRGAHGGQGRGHRQAVSRPRRCRSTRRRHGPVVGRNDPRGRLCGCHSRTGPRLRDQRRFGVRLHGGGQDHPRARAYARQSRRHRTGLGPRARLSAVRVGRPGIPRAGNGMGRADRRDPPSQYRARHPV
ncbi:Uncharacterised protein [Collinsella intestinalis]|nr:Uncharacterised protein [Collinsella intestinalis]